MTNRVIARRTVLRVGLGCGLAAGTLNGAVGVLAVLGTGCGGSTPPFVWAQQLPPAEQTGELRLGPEDEIHVLVAEQESLSGRFKLGPDGRYVHPVIGSISLTGLTPAEAGQQLATRLAGIVVRPQVTVSLVVRRPIRLSVLGEVRTPGHFDVPADESLIAVLARAGGLSEFADRDAIYVVRTKPELVRIRFRMRDLAGAHVESARFRLNDGDVILVE
jgi:polysaccharide biosynthesis/export protein